MERICGLADFMGWLNGRKVVEAKLAQNILEDSAYEKISRTELGKSLVEKVIRRVI